MRIEIKAADKAIIPQIVSLWSEFMDYHREINPLFTRRGEGHLNFRDYLEKLLSDGEAQVLAALDGGKVVAFSIARIMEYPPVFETAKHGEITDLAVKPEYRRRGIGEEMLERMMEWFKSKGMTRVDLRVASQNRIGRAFWEKQGFRTYLDVMGKGI